MLSNRKGSQVPLFITLLLALAGFGLGLVYEREILEARFQLTQLRTARLRYEDWAAFTTHVRNDLAYPERIPLSLTGSNNLGNPIIGPSPNRIAKIKPGCN